MGEAGVAQEVSPELKRVAAQRARLRARAARWDLNVAVFFFAILTIVVILLFEGIGIEVVAPVAILGLALGWLMGWRKGKQLYAQFYSDELSKLQQELRKTTEGTLEETIEEKVQKALRDRWK